MLDKSGKLVRPNYKWLTRLGLKLQDQKFVNNLKRLRQQKVTKVKQAQVTATYESTLDYDNDWYGLSSVENARPATNDVLFYTPQVCSI